MRQSSVGVVGEKAALAFVAVGWHTETPADPRYVL